MWCEGERVSLPFSCRARVGKHDLRSPCASARARTSAWCSWHLTVTGICNSGCFLVGFFNLDLSEANRSESACVFKGLLTLTALSSVCRTASGTLRLKLFCCDWCVFASPLSRPRFARWQVKQPRTMKSSAYSDLCTQHSLSERCAEEWSKAEQAEKKEKEREARFLASRCPSILACSARQRELPLAQCRLLSLCPASELLLSTPVTLILNSAFTWTVSQLFKKLCTLLVFPLCIKNACRKHSLFVTKITWQMRLKHSVPLSLIPLHTTTLHSHK